METAGTTTIVAPTAYVGRHRSPKLHPRPLPLQHLDGLLDAAVTVHLGAGEPYVMLTSDVDQAIIELTPKQVDRILASAGRSTKVADYDPTDAELAATWNGPDAPAVHRAAWTLHQELHDRSAS